MNSSVSFFFSYSTTLNTLQFLQKESKMLGKEKECLEKLTFKLRLASCEVNETALLVCDWSLVGWHNCFVSPAIHFVNIVFQQNQGPS